MVAREEARAGDAAVGAVLGRVGEQHVAAAVGLLAEHVGVALGVVRHFDLEGAALGDGAHRAEHPVAHRFQRDVAAAIVQAEAELQVEDPGLHVHTLALRVHGVGLAGEEVEVRVAHPGHAVLPPFRAPAVHDQEAAHVAEHVVVVAHHAHGMTPEAGHPIVRLRGEPAFLALHVLHEGAAHHHADHHGRALRQVLLHGQHVGLLVVGALREPLEALDAVLPRTAAFAVIGQFAAALVGVGELAEGQHPAIEHVLHGAVDVGALATAVGDLDLVVQVAGAEGALPGIGAGGLRLHDGARRVGAGPGHAAALHALVQPRRTVPLQRHPLGQRGVHVVGQRFVHLGLVVQRRVELGPGGEACQLPDHAAAALAQVAALASPEEVEEREEDAHDQQQLGLLQQQAQQHRQQGAAHAATGAGVGGTPRRAVAALAIALVGHHADGHREVGLALDGRPTGGSRISPFPSAGARRG